MANVDPWISQAQNNIYGYQSTGGNLQNYLGNQANYYGNIQDAYRGQADQAYDQLAQTPGYNQQQSAAIMGNPNAGFGYYDPGQLQGQANNNAADLSGATQGYQQGLTGAAQGLGQGVTGAAGNLAGSLQGAAGQAAQTLAQPAGTEANWLGGTYSYLRNQNEGALGGLQQGLGNAIDPNKLSVSNQFAQSYQMTPEQQQNIKNVAAQTVQGQYQKMSDELDRRAAAEGNSSPTALAAMKAVDAAGCI
jgi:hypothetical protein